MGFERGICMKRMISRGALLVAAGILAVGAVACSSDSTDETATATATSTEDMTDVTVNATLSEWKVEIDRDSAPAGQVHFAAKNEGAIPHELVVVKSDLAEDALPVVDGKVNEDAVDFIGEIEEFPAGESAEAAFSLESGKYILFCNIPAHYEQGMHTSFTVE